MRSTGDDVARRILLLLKLDANNLFRRIKDRKTEYLEIFALRRTREHFPQIFANRYQQTTVAELAHCSSDLIALLDQFYTPVEEMSWYLYETQDMPNTVEDFIDRKIRRMEKLLGSLNLYLDAELGIHGLEAPVTTVEDFPAPLEDDTSLE